jgi:hypothetical protein
MLGYIAPIRNMRIVLKKENKTRISLQIFDITDTDRENIKMLNSPNK